MISVRQLAAGQIPLGPRDQGQLNRGRAVQLRNTHLPKLHLSLAHQYR